ncbi:MAG: Crp/Fnr family transcriptional regulator, partial [Halanaerobiales bacterium]
MKRENINYLREFILFSRMGDQNLKQIKELMVTKRYSPGEVIFLAGEKGDRVFFLKQGKVKVTKTSRTGDEQILEIIQPGEVFGEVVLFGIPEYPANAEAAGKVEVEYLTREKFRRFFCDNPEVGWGMMEVMARKLARSQ